MNELYELIKNDKRLQGIKIDDDNLILLAHYNYLVNKRYRSHIILELESTLSIFPYDHLHRSTCH